MFLVETGESRTPNMALTVADALRDLSGALARLADTLEKPAQIRWNREDGSLALLALTQGTDISR